MFASPKTVVETQPGCVAATLAVIGHKWTGLILKELAAGPRRFSGLEQALSGISPRTLSRRLDDLEAHGIIRRQEYCDNPPRFEYALTKKGRDLIPVLRTMAKWGTKYAA